MMRLVLVSSALWLALSPIRAQEIEIMKYPQLLDMMKDCGTKEIRVYNFWATWCKPCIEELPYLENLNENYSNVEVHLISFDDISDLDTKVRPFVQQKRLKSRIYLLDETDYNAFIDLIDSRWTGAIPATVIIKCPDRTKYFFEKSFKENELNDIVDNLY